METTELKITPTEWLKTCPPDPLIMTIINLGLSGRTYNALRRKGIETVGQILEMSLYDLYNIRGIGNKGYIEVLTSLLRLGYLPFNAMDKFGKVGE